METGQLFPPLQYACMCSFCLLYSTLNLVMISNKQFILKQFCSPQLVSKVKGLGDDSPMAAQSDVVAGEHFTQPEGWGNAGRCVDWGNSERCVQQCCIIRKTIRINRLEDEKNISLLLSSGRDKSFKGKCRMP